MEAQAQNAPFADGDSRVAVWIAFTDARRHILLVVIL
jgi:hypothetical protein